MEISPNSLSFIALSNEFCSAVENVAESTPSEFVDSMVRLLPRLYISASDLKIDPLYAEEAAIDPYLEEEYYDSIRRRVENLLGPEDIYLEVFEEDMKYSETPIGMSISEGIADLFQVLYNFLMNVKDAPTESIQISLAAVKEDFGEYWSQRLCNLMRPLNHLHFHQRDDEE